MMSARERFSRQPVAAAQIKYAWNEATFVWHSYYVSPALHVAPSVLLGARRRRCEEESRAQPSYTRNQAVSLVTTKRSRIADFDHRAQFLKTPKHKQTDLHTDNTQSHSHADRSNSHPCVWRRSIPAGCTPDKFTRINAVYRRWLHPS